MSQAGQEMPGIVEFPKIVQEALEQYRDVFTCEPQRRHFAEYLTGLLIAERKTVLGIHREFADITDQSCLNKFLTLVEWDVGRLNRRRLELLQKDPSTCYHAQGIIALDNVLLDHDGKLIEDVGYFWDHADERHKLAHDYLFANYVCRSGKHYPLDFRRFKKRDQCEAAGETFQDHNVLFRQLVDWVVQEKIPGDFTFDNYFTTAENLNHIHAKKDEDGWPRCYVGDLKFNRKVEWKGGVLKASEMAAQIELKDRKETEAGGKKQYYFTVTLHIPKVDHKVRVVILWKKREDQAPCKILVTNRVTWEVGRILGVYRKRWTGTETFHRDGKQELGMGACQLRSGVGQTRHMHLVMVAYSSLMHSLAHSRPQEWALGMLTTIGQACRAVLRESLRNTIAWAVRQVTENSQPLDKVVVHLGLA